MPRLIAFLRAINVGGHTVTMARLRKEFEALGFTDVETFIASGNVIFTAPQGDLAALEKKIEARLLKSLGYEVATFVRTCDEVAAVAGCRPFPSAQIDDEAAVYVGFVERPLERGGYARRDDIQDRGRRLPRQRPRGLLAAQDAADRLTVQVRQPGKDAEDPRDLPRHQHRGAPGREARARS